jgi:hypothetical protein
MLDAERRADPRSPRRVWHCCAVGCKRVMELLRVVADPGEKRVPEVACVAALGAQLIRAAALPDSWVN